MPSGFPQAVTLAITATEVADAVTVGNAGGSYYYGIALRETADADAVVYIREDDVSGKIIDAIGFVAGESVADLLAHPIFVDGLIYVDIDSGAVEGTIRHL